MTRMGRVRSSSGVDGTSEFPEAAEAVALTFCTKDSASVLGMVDGSTAPDMVDGSGSSVRTTIDNGEAPTKSVGRRLTPTQRRDVDAGEKKGEMEHSSR